MFTDPDRTPDPAALARRLPRGAAVVYRHFGAADRASVARTLAAIARRRGLVLLIGADAPLASAVGAAGVHLPERMANEGASLRRTRPGWLITAAAHGPRALRRATGLDAVVLSPVFASRSPSAGKPLGLTRARLMARTAMAPVIALGGVGRRAVRAITHTGFAGVAGIDLFL